MSAENPSDARTPPAPPADSGYRTLTPGTPAATPTAQGASPKPTATPGTPAAAATPPAKPEASKDGAAKDEAHPDPTRFGDWEVKGRCIDF